MPRSITPLLLLACVLLAVGCGDDGDSSTASSASSGDSTADFIAAADAICVSDAEAQIALRLDPPAGEGVEAEVARLEALEEIVAGAVEEMEALEPPEELSADWEAYLENRREAADVLAQRVVAVETDPNGAGALGNDVTDRLAEERDEIGKEAGFGACGRVLPAEQDDEVRRTVEEAFSSEDADVVCNELYGEEFITGQFNGSIDRCLKVVGREPLAGLVGFSEVDGIDEVLATAEASFKGGPGNGLRGTVNLIYADGAWQVVSLELREGEEAG